MTDEKKEIKGKTERIIKKFFLRVFVIVLTTVLFISWLFVGLNKIDFMYAIWVSLAVLGSWIIIMVGRAINERNLSLRTDRSGKPYVAEEMGVLSAMPREEDSDSSENV